MSKALQLAEGVEQMREGQLLALGPNGEILDARAVKMRTIAGWGVALAVGGALSGVLAMFLGGISGGTAFAIYTVLLARGARRIAKVRQVHTLAMSGKRDEAYELALTIPRRGLGDDILTELDTVIATLEWLRGDRESALRRFDELAVRLRAARSGYASVNAWKVRFSRAHVLATMGRIGEAKLAFAELADMPDTAYFQIGKQGAHLAIAFHADEPGFLPEDEVLHEWARAGLGRTLFGEMLVLLAWAFERRGDLEMAQLLAREAPSRLLFSYLADADPQAKAWLDDALARWGPAEPE